MNTGRACRACSLALVALAAASRAYAGDNYVLVVSGASGGEPYASKYDGWRRSFVSTLRERFGYSDDRIVELAETAGPGIGSATRAEVERALVDFRRRLGKDDTLVVLLIGHGSSADGQAGEDARFNLVGPDLKASDWAGLLRPLPSSLVFIDTTAASFAFLRHVAGPGRVVITATDSSAQEFETVFGEFFVRAFTDPAADADKNGRVSIAEAFAYASAGVRRWFDEHDRLPTERALIDDEGDGVGREADTLASAGALARTVYLQPVAVPADATLAALVKRQAELEAQLEDLRKKQPSLAPAVYEAERERLLVELARVSAQMRGQS